ncbi:MAG: hypothetical protein DME26_17575 [Verrucomicrobia bacterium]|nr:MAG: hypothetical protein DME26_17575 [Verrucomicrobiota bacterium]
MKTIKKDELFRSLSDFLNTKGVQLKDGVYAQRINRACGLLTDAINGAQKTAKHARVKVNKKLDQFRQTIHKATAPKSAFASPAPDTIVAGRTRKKTVRPKPKSSAPSRKSSRRV